MIFLQLVCDINHPFDPSDGIRECKSDLGENLYSHTVSEKNDNADVLLAYASLIRLAKERQWVKTPKGWYCPNCIARMKLRNNKKAI